MLVTQWLVDVSFIPVTEVLVTPWLVQVSFISVTEALVIAKTVKSYLPYIYKSTTNISIF